MGSMDPVLGRYQKVDIIGRGSFGDVYRGWVHVQDVHLSISLVALWFDLTPICTACRVDTATKKEVAIKAIELDNL